MGQQAALGHLGPAGLTEQGLVREFLTETHEVTWGRSGLGPDF